MYEIKRCTDVSDDQIYHAFSEGFADYIIQFNIKKEDFINKFFGIEGNVRQYSFIAIKANQPIGIVLGGILTIDSVKTMRCGGMAVIKDERGSGVALKLMESHYQCAKNNNCKQLFLEVLTNNDRAISFYNKLNYTKIFDLTYRKINVKDISLTINNQLYVEETTLNDVLSLREYDKTHLPWQSDFEYFKHLNISCYCIKSKKETVAGIIAHANRILYMFVLPNYRFKGYGISLINKVISSLKPESLQISYSNNALIHQYCNKLGFNYLPFKQYEMYKLIV